jgi:LysM repeat protein
MMKRFTSPPRIILLFVAIVTLVVWQPVMAQGQNLLTNPGFESPFTAYSDALPARQVAQGWLPWYTGGGQSASENVYPEYYPASNVSDGLGIPRVRSGTDAQQYLSFFATHDAGVYQRVTGVSQGTQLRFSAYVYVWSTSFDDVNVSEADGGVIVQVGIDPTGGTSGDSPNIVWSSPSIQYDAYNEYSVTATASGSAVTVFVRTTVSNPVQNNNIYVDDAALVVSGASQPPTATTAPTQTRVPPTNTSVPPTQTPIPPATNTLVVPTSTPLTVETATAGPINTSEPAIETPTATPTLPPTNTDVPPTQEVLPSATPTSNVPVSGDFPGQVVHTVRAGDTVGQLATLYGSTIDAIISANGLNPSALIRVGQALVIPVRLGSPATSTPTVTPVVPVVVPTAVPEQPTTTVYVVQSGDTLNRIAARFNTSVAAIAQLNGITNVNLIQVGQRLVVPVGGSVVVPPPANTPVPAPSQPTSSTYVVQPGDTMFRIALRFGISLARLAQANGITDPSRVYAGQVLVIP